MKTIKNLLLIAAATLGIASCSDIPAPYDIFEGGSDSFGKSLPYKSASLSTGWTMHCLSEVEPWSQGSSYTQATGYQDWDGTGSKYNKAVESYLISPAFNTKAESGMVRISFDHTLRYTNNVSGWENNHKIFISKDYDGKDFDAATWAQLNYTPAASQFSDWTLYESGYIALPEEYVNQDGVYVAFYFKAPATASTTWELENFLIEEGEATQGGTTGGEDTPSDATEITCAQAVELCNALADGATSTETYSITGYITDVFANISNNQQSFWMADTKDGGKILQAFWANLPAGVQSFTKGSKIKITGPLTKYVKNGTVTTEIKNGNVEILEAGAEGEDNPVTPEVPTDGAMTVAQAIAAQGTTGTVTGYIVAALKAGVASSTGAISDFEFSGFTGYNALFIADTPTETNPANMLCVKLNDSESPADLKSKVNLKDNPGNLGKKLTVTGNLKSCYTGLKGIRGITAYTLEGEGTTPNTPTTPTTPTEVKHITIAEFLGEADTNTTYELTGTVGTLKAGDQYGNFDLTDETGTIYIYGLLDLAGTKKNFQNTGVKEGDKITVTGKYKDYNGKAEIADAQLIRIEK